jgi:hypothetical protein
MGVRIPPRVRHRPTDKAKARESFIAAGPAGRAWEAAAARPRSGRRSNRGGKRVVESGAYSSVQKE